MLYQNPVTVIQRSNQSELNSDAFCFHLQLGSFYLFQLMESLFNGYYVLLLSTAFLYADLGITQLCPTMRKQVKTTIFAE